MATRVFHADLHCAIILETKRHMLVEIMYLTIKPSPSSGNLEDGLQASMTSSHGVLFFASRISTNATIM